MHLWPGFYEGSLYGGRGRFLDRPPSRPHPGANLQTGEVWPLARRDEPADPLWRRPDEPASAYSMMNRRAARQR